MTMLFQHASILFLLLVTKTIHGAAIQRTSDVLSRTLQVDGMKDFVPLACNANIASEQCFSWTTLFGTATSFSENIIIPCGKCITMDVVGGTLDLLGGLDVIGKLVFPDGYRLNVSSTIIVVQGELEMIATKPVDGIPSIKFTMIGDVAKSFTPIDANANACNGARTCTAGKKGIVVAGGKVNIHGIPNATPAWLKLYDVVGTSNNPSTILVSNSVVGKWGIGAQILITPHTAVWNQTQVRTITSITSTGSNAVIQLDKSIIRPTTTIESLHFAVEVALLSRNIVFEGGSDNTATHGGHFMVMNTPSVIQTIEGVDFRNFGQQGILGRYPIHFHFCGDVAGSIVSKNTIRQSKQRCVVVHGTNRLRIEENVAYDTKGHCYMTEDGMEMNNLFIRNLGAQTGKPAVLIPNNGSNGNETDDEPATFWITAPTNYFEGNVAAGSEHSGYWFEPKLRGVRASMYPNLDPQFSPLGSFKDNVAHSNTALRLGAIRMYEPGYFPSTMTSFTGLKVYRNNAVGIFIHRCHNLRVDQGLFADNTMGIDLDRAEGIEVTNTEVIGLSPSYKALMNRSPAGSVKTICERSERVGIDLHTWQKEIDYIGAKISNVTISGFAPDPLCPKPSSLRFDRFNLKQGLFEFYTAFERMKLADGLNSINMCVVNDTETDVVEYDLIYIIDLDGTFSPNPVVAPTISTLVASDNKMHLTFLDPSKCVDNAVGCYSYCHDTCFRSMRYYVEGPSQERYKLKVCSRDDPSRCSLFKGGRRDAVGPHEFTAHLIAGQLYNAVFLDGFGNETTPLKVTEVVEKTFCTTGVFEVKLFGHLGGTISPAARPVTPPVPVRAPVRPPAPVPFTVPIASVKAPTKIPTVVTTRAPSKMPTAAPTNARTKTPTKTPVSEPTKLPTAAPTPAPSKMPTTAPTKALTKIPTSTPASDPTKIPTTAPTPAPSKMPTTAPTNAQTKPPTRTPTSEPTKIPNPAPTKTPTRAPTHIPTKIPAKAPIPAPIVVAVPSPVIASVPTITENCTMIQWYLYNANTDLVVASLHNGTVINAPPPCGRTNIEALLPCPQSTGTTATVVIELYDTRYRLLKSRKKAFPKYFLFGNQGSNVNAGRINAGTYLIRAVVNGLVSPFTRFTLGGTC